MSVRWANIEQRTSEWYAFRRTGPPENPYKVAVGASEVHRLLSDPDGATSAALLAQKATGEQGTPNAAMLEGIRQEASIIASYVAMTGNVGRPRICWRDETPFVFASLDHVSVAADGLVIPAEMKLINSGDFYRYVMNNQVPPQHVAQVQTQMWCCDSDVLHYFARSFSGEEHLVVVFPDATIQFSCTEAARRFCESARRREEAPEKEESEAAIVTVEPFSTTFPLVPRGVISQIAVLHRKALALPPLIKSPEEESAVATVKVGLTMLRQTIDKARTSAKAPFLNAGRAVDSKAKELLGPVTEAEERCDALLGDWALRERARERAEREAQAEAVRKAVQSAASIDEAAPLVKTAIETIPVVEASKADGLARTLDVEFDIVDEAYVPRYLCEPSRPLIKQWLKKVLAEQDGNEEKFAKWASEAVKTCGIAARVVVKTKKSSW